MHCSMLCDDDDYYFVSQQACSFLVFHFICMTITITTVLVRLYCCCRCRCLHHPHHRHRQFDLSPLVYSFWSIAHFMGNIENREFSQIDSKFIIIIECCWLFEWNWTVVELCREKNIQHKKRKTKRKKNKTRGDGHTNVFIHLLATRWRSSYCSCNFAHNHFWCNKH